MQPTGIIDRVKHVLRRTANKVSNTQSLPLRRGAPALENLGNRSLLTPPVDVLENEQEIMICVEVPGAQSDNTEINWSERSGLSLYVRRESPSGRPLHAESPDGADWFRSFQVPDYVDYDRAQSQLKNGVLSIRLPKLSAGKRRTVRIVEEAG